MQARLVIPCNGGRPLSASYTIRTFHRFPVELSIHYLAAQFIGKGCARNLSRNGWQIEGDHTVQPGMKLSLSVHFPGESEPVTIEQAVVRWVHGRTFGVKIALMQPKDWHRLSRIVNGLVQQQLRAPRF